MVLFGSARRPLAVLLRILLRGAHQATAHRGQGRRARRLEHNLGNLHQQIGSPQRTVHWPSEAPQDLQYTKVPEAGVFG